MSPIEKCILVNENLGLTFKVEDFEKFDQFIAAQTLVKNKIESEIMQQITEDNLKIPLTSTLFTLAAKKEVISKDARLKVGKIKVDDMDKSFS